MAVLTQSERATCRVAGVGLRRTLLVAHALILAKPKGAIRSVPGLQGYLAHKKLLTRRTLQQDHIKGHMVVLGGGRFLLGEVSL